MIRLKSYSAKSHQGPYLQVNEDGVLVDYANRLAIVMDGFGGAGIGDVCIQKIRDQIKNFYLRASKDPDATMPFYFSIKYLLEGNALINAFHYAHDSMLKENKTKDMSNRGGASVIGVSQSENLLTFVSAGNIFALLSRKGTLDIVLAPDSLQFVSDDRFTGQYSTSPLSGIGLFQELHLNCREIKVQEGDQIVLMTDGVYSRLAYRELRHIISDPDQTSADKINALFKTSCQRGNMDNQTALFLHY
ncbi:MAG: hypothetical protein A2X86_04145 [Bdellovibrionales bacterium GWA2_49_15]|nr:MAG: hypothetical protein A2X86_04145 [Bdellovibrionales bacterium GWA2_49_15]HAZ12803.1 hypothetical protein [Bdellovibrionales bacterium]